MNKQNQFDKKRRFKQQQNDDDDDEQIEKTLNFFDSILDQYLTDQDIIDENNIQKSSPQVKSTNDISIPQNGTTTSNHTTTSSSTSPSSRYIPSPQFRRRFEQISHVRRYTSENNLDQIPSLSKPKLSHSRPLQTTVTSTDDLSTIPSPTRRSNFIKKIDYLTSNGASASLIDLSSLDKLSSRPRFRFVPPSNDNHLLKEEPEIEQKFHLKTIQSDSAVFNNQIKSSHKIVKPTVIIPSVPKSAPINRLTETHIHHQNGNSAFKTHRSSRNGVSSKIQQIKRTESINKSNKQLSNNDVLFHQSLLNLSSSEPKNSNRFEPRTSYQSNKSNGSHPIIQKDSISKWIQQVNNTSSINGLVYSGNNRSQQQTYPHGPYISKSTGISPPMNNHHQQTYFNPINVHKYQSHQHSVPVYLVPPPPPPVTRNGIFPLSASNIYNFNQNNSPRDRRQSKSRNPNRQNVTITTYL